MNDSWLPTLEALADPRIGSLPFDAAAAGGRSGPDADRTAVDAAAPGGRSDPDADRIALEEAAAAGLVERDGDRAVLAPTALDAVQATLIEKLRGRRIDWTDRLTEGALLDRFADHCRDDLDDVSLLAAHPTRLDLEWRGGEGTVELRAGLVGAERLGGTHLMLTSIDDALVSRFLDDETLRARIAVCDVTRLEKVNAVRSSLCVYFEWFLREAFGARILPAEAFTAGLVQRGILSLGMG